MQILSEIFSVLFLIMGALIWIVAMTIVLIGAIGLLRITVRETFKTDVIEWYATYKKRKENE